jgi:hypothetical protein
MCTQIDHFLSAALSFKQLEQLSFANLSYPHLDLFLEVLMCTVIKVVAVQIHCLNLLLIPFMEEQKVSCLSLESL